MIRLEPIKYKPTGDIIKDVVSRFNSQLEYLIKSVTPNGSNWDIELCEATHITDCDTLTIDGNQYEVNAVVDNIVTVSGSPEPPLVSFTLPPFKFFRGTPLMTNEELLRIQNTWDKLPMIYLFEKISDRVDSEFDSRFDRESSIRLFFLTHANISEWVTDDYYQNAIKQMTNMANVFLEFIGMQPDLGDVSNLGLDYHNKFIVYASVDGNAKRIFNDGLSGVELSFDLPIEKDYKCKDC